MIFFVCLFTVLFYIFAKCILQTFCILADNICPIHDEVTRRFSVVSNCLLEVTEIVFGFVFFPASHRFVVFHLRTVRVVSDDS